MEQVLGADEEAVWLLLPLRDETVVLVVDDNQELFSLFQRYTVGQPYRLIFASSAQEALGHVSARVPDMITLDLMMPNQDGWELLQALRSSAATAHVPVVVCSVLEESELAHSVGADVYVRKPISRGEFLRALEAARSLDWEGGESPGAPARSAADPRR